MSARFYAPTDKVAVIASLNRLPERSKSEVSVRLGESSRTYSAVLVSC